MNEARKDIKQHRREMGRTEGIDLEQLPEPQAARSICIDIDIPSKPNGEGFSARQPVEPWQLSDKGVSLGDAEDRGRCLPRCVPHLRQHQATESLRVVSASQTRSLRGVAECRRAVLRADVREMWSM